MQVWGKRTKPMYLSGVCDLGTTYSPFFYLLPNGKGKSWILFSMRSFLHVLHLDEVKHCLNDYTVM